MKKSNENQWDVFEAILKRMAVSKEESKEWTDRWRAAKQRVPIELKLYVRDSYGRDTTYTYLWDAVDLGPGKTGIRVDTGYTDSDQRAVRAYVEARLGI